MDYRTRVWWVPASPTEEPCGARERAKVEFLNTAASRGLRPFREGFAVGALGAGRECLVLDRGRQRAEVVLWDETGIVEREILWERETGAAMKEATDKALAWLGTDEPT
jgi:hypothetical protein